MNHKEKTELLDAFAQGVKARDWNQLDKVLQQYEAMRSVSIIRQIQRENFSSSRNADSKEVERLKVMSHLLEQLKKQTMKDSGLER